MSYQKKHQKIQSEEKSIAQPEIADSISIDLNEIRNQAITEAKKTTHAWRQRGPYLVCTSCANSHAIHIGPFSRLKGFKDNGEPILERSSLFTEQQLPKKIGDIESQ